MDGFDVEYYEIIAFLFVKTHQYCIIIIIIIIIIIMLVIITATVAAAMSVAVRNFSATGLPSIQRGCACRPMPALQRE